MVQQLNLINFNNNRNGANNMLDPNKFVVVDSDSFSEAGALVYFRCVATEATELNNALRRTGAASAIPELPSSEVALHRALESLRSKRRLVRPVEGGGWAVVDEAVDASGTPDVYALQLVVRHDASNRLTFTPDGHPLEVDIENAYSRHKSEYAATDISQWLVKLCEAHDGVSPRERGGIYFIPKPRLESFREQVGALHEASESRVFYIPAMKSDEAVEAILDAVTREAQDAAASMEDVLNRHLEAIAEREAFLEAGTPELANSATAAGKRVLGKRAIRTQLTKLQPLGRKLKLYEALLGKSMAALQKRLDDVKANLVVAALALETEKEGS